MSNRENSRVCCRGCALDAPVIRLVEIEGAFHLFADLWETLEASGYRVRTYESVDEMLLQEPRSDSGCIVLGVQMLGPEGLQLHELLASKSSLPVILVTSSATAREVVRAMKQGAADFFCEPLNGEAFLAAVGKAVADHQLKTESAKRHAAFQLRRASLTARELQVYELLLRGASNKQMQERLGLAERTVKHHRSHVMEKMGAKTVVQLVRTMESMSSEISMS